MGVQAIPFTLFQDRGLEKRNRALRYDLNAMAEFEQVTGMGLGQLMQTNAVFAATRALLWAGLRWQDRGLTIDVAGSLMQDFMQAGGSIRDILNECLQACAEQKAIPGLKTREEQEADEAALAGGSDPNDARTSPQTGTPSVLGPAGSEPSSSTPTGA